MVRQIRNMSTWSQRLEQFLPDSQRRRVLLSYFDEAMRNAERFAGKWSVNGRYGGLSLVVGRLIVLSLQEGRIWSALDTDLLSGRADLANALQRSASWKWDETDYPRYVVVPSRNGFFEPGDDASRVWPAVRELLFTLMKRSADSVKALPRRSRKAHEPSLVRAIRRDLKEVVDSDVPIIRNRNRTPDTKRLDDELIDFVEISVSLRKAFGQTQQSAKLSNVTRLNGRVDITKSEASESVNTAGHSI